MNRFSTKVRSYIDEHSLFTQGEKIIVAVSGGPDSMALLHYLLNEAGMALQIEAAHVDHLLRGEESAADASFVQGFCQTQGIPCHITNVNVKEKMSESGIGLQEAAREMRYSFLKEVMKRAGASKLVLGHHADDQIETVLFRLIRGSTMKGRAGILPKRTFGPGELVRPLLMVTKEEIEQYCEHHRIKVRRDPSNEKDDYTRNRLRNHVIPLLKEENPSLHEQIIRYTEEMLEDERFMEEKTKECLPACIIHQKNQYIKLDQQKWSEVAPPLQRRMIHLILNYLYAKVPTSLTSTHTSAIKKLLLQKHPSGELHLPEGLLVKRSYSTAVFEFAPSNSASPFRYQLDIGQTIKLPSGAYVTAAEGLVEGLPERADFCRLELSQTAWPLTVRTRKDGDRIELKGLDGPKKIKKIFIDEKVPVDLRGQWPIITDASGRVLWIPGMRTAKAAVKPKDGSRAYTLIHYKDNF
ncbi:tRNA lysidine(34) synthetase TilS [Jeotgalibacillus proteolyticus]|uniref:tRNA(Ile)-lysidine synthase n=1 Tax=Jeotgalibacillus proteolyticus TaxID=2082395 RepID=A0A2S5G6E6_9BACL|nr:tRNA lysidine(34) synthetase TilS [Jeotgalibacillus proteolyticus]PPA68550.1 tRNA lysidine(34) synthetase TilS [Jeotgalibacillus proteolyticus]